MAKINFIYPINVSDEMPQLALMSLRAAMSKLNTAMLSSKASPRLKKVQILVDADLSTRVSYDPLTGVITANPDKKRMRHKTQGLIPNVLFALSMAYFDFALKSSDRLYWKNLTRREKIDKSLLSRISFRTEQTGKSRLLFSSELTKYFLLGVSQAPIIVRFFNEEVSSLVELSPNRFRGLIPNSDKEDAIIISQSLGDSETLPLSQALDVTGITGVTDKLRDMGCSFSFDYDETGLFVFNATKNGEKMVQIKRSFHYGEIRNDYFAIAPELQRQGIGLKVFATQLMSAVQNDIKAINLTAERDEENGLFGYNVWWRFGFDGYIDAKATSNAQGSEDWWVQSVTERVIGSSDIDLKLRFYGMLKRLQDKVENGLFSPTAFQYLLDRTLEGDYQSKEDFAEPSRKDFLSLVQFFNRISPESPFLKEEGLSFKYQRIQRLLELEGFEDWWATNGVKWEAKLDLSLGESSPSIAILRDYMKERGL